MGLLLPSRSEKDSKKLGVAYFIRVCFLLGMICVLTWYGKIHKPEPNISRITDFAIWIFPSGENLSALIALPSDGNDSNLVKTGFRLWLSPPDSALAIENGGIRYRGNAMAIIGDSLKPALKDGILSTLDSNGTLLEYWEVENSLTEYAGEDVFLNLRIIDGNPNDYILDVICEEHLIRFFGSRKTLEIFAQPEFSQEFTQNAMAGKNYETDKSREPLSAAILMFNANEKDISSLNVETVIWNGLFDYDEAIGLISFNKKNEMRLQRLHLKNWKR